MNNNKTDEQKQTDGMEENDRRRVNRLDKHKDTEINRQRSGAHLKGTGDEQ